MKKTKLFKRMLAGILAGVMCGSMSIGAFAATTFENGNIWYADEMSREVIAGENGYTFMSIYKKPFANYETSNHVLQKAGAVSLLPMIDASENYTWAPDGLYKPYASNYEVMYCCDLDTDYNDGIYYKRLNLEDSEYFNDEQARKIRAIVTNSYPYVSLETMKEMLAETGFEQAEEIDRADAIAAVQAAIWNCANGHEDTYRGTVNLQIVGTSWGGVMHDYSAEMSQAIQTQPARDAVYPEIGERLEALIAHLLTLEETYADKAEIIISKLEMKGTPIQVTDDTVQLQLELDLNNSGSGYEDNIEITIKSSCDEVKIPVVLGTEEYFAKITANINDEIKAVVSGTQVLPAGVYFYAPKAADTDGDGIATSREVSQNLVGVAMGETPVYAEASIEFYERVINFEKTTTSEQGEKPLEGIVFDIYYAGSVEEYTAYIQEVVKTYGGNKEEFMVAAQDKFEEAKANEIKAGNIAPIATVETDIRGNAVYSLTRNGQEDGIYLIIEREHPSVKAPLAPFAVAVPMNTNDGSGLRYQINIQPKNEVYTPEINKDVIEINNSEEQQKESVNANEEFTWIVRGDIPADIADAKKYVITDTLDYRLTYAEDLVVKVEEIAAAADNSNSGNVLKEKVDYKLNVADAEGTVEGQDTKTITVTLTNKGMDKVASLVGEQGEDYEIRVYFNTIIDADAAVGEEILNQATLIYKNSANFETEVESDDPVVYTCGINVKKYDAKEVTTFLAGAEFMVARKATDAEIADETIETESLVIAKGQPEVVVFVDFYNSAALTGEKVNTIVTNETGDAIVYGLEEGTYYLVETKAPAGYNLLSYPVSITLNQVSHSAENTVKVANSNSFVLPGTGGIGTTIFTLVGAALSLGSGAVLVGKKRKEEE